MSQIFINDWRAMALNDLRSAWKKTKRGSAEDFDIVWAIHELELGKDIDKTLKAINYVIQF